MKAIKKYSLLLIIIIAFSVNVSAATKLTPMHIYKWAKTHNISRLHQFKQYINLYDENQNTALCLAQQKKDKTTYDLLLKFGASTKVRCHNHNDPICNVTGAGVVVTKSSIDYKKTGLLLLGGGAIAAAIGSGGGSSAPKICPEGYSTDYTDVSSCGTSGTGINGWIHEINGNVDGIACGKCTKRMCESPSTTDEANTYLGLISSSKIENNFSGDDKCYIYEYECDISQKHYPTCDGFSTCSEKNISVQNSDVNSVTCYIPEPCQTTDFKDKTCPTGTLTASSCSDNTGTYHNCYCNEKTHFADKQNCENAKINIGYNCKYDEETKCYTQYEVEKCDETNGYFSSIKTVEDCTKNNHPEGWYLTSKGYSGPDQCNKCNTVLCNANDGYFANIDDTPCNKAYDGPRNQEGYEIIESDIYYSGDTSCKKCSPKTCQAPTVETSHDGAAVIDDCNNNHSEILKISGYTTQGYAAEKGCFTCSYECNEISYSYDDKDKCEEGGRSCTRYDFTLYGVSYTCYKPDTCPSEYKFDEECPNGMASQGSCSLPNITKHKCECNTAQYYYKSKEDCEAVEANAGYQCNKKNDTETCIHRGDDKTCTGDFSTTYQSIENCGSANLGDKGWEFSDQGKSGDLLCGKCTPLSCERNDATTAETPTSVPNELVFKDKTPVTDLYSGDSQCYKHIYGCNNDNGYYASNECPENATCTNSQSYSVNYGEDNTYTCYTMDNCDTTTYSFQTQDNQCPTGTTEDKRCFDNSGIHLKCLCDENNHFAEYQTCKDKNTGFECYMDTTTSCYIKSTECNTAEGYFNPTEKDACEDDPNNPGYTCAIDAGTGCYKKTETCNTTKGYYQGKDACESADDNFGFICEIDNTNGCYVVTSSCNNNKGFYDHVEKCEETGFHCDEDSQTKCYIRTEDAIECIEQSATEARLCSKTGTNGWNITSKIESYKGGQPCYQCVAKTCPDGFTKGLHEDSCSAGYQYEIPTDPEQQYEGDEICGKCKDVSCATGTTDETPAQLQEGLVHIKNQPIPGEFAGEQQCHKFELACNEDKNYFPSCNADAQCITHSFTIDYSAQSSYTCYTMENCDTQIYPTQTQDNTCTIGKVEDKRCVDNDGVHLKCKCNETTHFSNPSICLSNEDGYNCVDTETPGCYYPVTGSCNSTKNFYPSKEACEENSKGYACKKATENSTCWKKDETQTLDCEEGTETSATLCGDSSLNGIGWTLGERTNKFSAGLECQKCVEKTCASPHVPSAGTTAYESDCEKYRPVFLRYDGLVNSGLNPAYAGDHQCFRCNFKCAIGYYTNKEECLSSNLNCNENKTTLFGIEYTCYSAETCNTADFPVTGSCGDGRYSSGSCTYSNITYNSCKCDTDNYYYESPNECNEASPGYQCNKSNSTGTCIHRGDAKTCTGDFSTSYQTIDDCGSANLGDKGWEFSNQGKAGDLLCGKCTPKSCEPYGATTDETPSSVRQELVFKDKAPVYNHYSGDSQCYKHRYGCNNNNGYYASNECPENATCTNSQSYSVNYGEQTAYTCYTMDNCNTTTYSFQTQNNQCPTGTTEDKRCVDNSGIHLKCLCNENSHFAEYQTCKNNNTGYDCHKDTTTGCYIKKSECNTAEGYFATESICEDPTNNNGYECQQAANSDCWKKTGTPLNCPDNYEINADLCGTSKSQGWTLGSTINKYSAGYQCQQCVEKTCTSPANAAAGYTAVEGDCTKDMPTFLTYDGIINTGLTPLYAGDHQCYKCSYKCAPSYYISNDSCMSANPNSECTENTITLFNTRYSCYNVSGCSAEFSVPDTCGEGRKSLGSCTYNGRTYHNCVCDTSQYYYETPDICKEAQNGYKCDVINNTSTCTNRGTPKECPQGSTTNSYPTTGHDQLTFVEAVATNSYAGDNVCYKHKYTCDNSKGYYATCPQYASCTNAVTYTANYSNEPNYSCQTLYACPLNYLDNDSCRPNREEQARCFDGGGLHLKCSCTGNYYDEYEDCKAANMGYDCTEDTASGCYIKATNCNTAEGYFATESICEDPANNNGYECQQVENSDCWKETTTPLACPEIGDTRTATLVDDCSRTGTNGWILTNENTIYKSGGLTCKKCQEQSCSAVGASTEYSDISQCPSIEYLKVSGNSNLGQYSGDDACYTCSYECDTTQQYIYSKYEDCSEKNTNCESKNTSTGFGLNSVTCTIATQCDTSGYENLTTNVECPSLRSTQKAECKDYRSTNVYRDCPCNTDSNYYQTTEECEEANPDSFCREMIFDNNVCPISTSTIILDRCPTGEATTVNGCGSSGADGWKLGTEPTGNKSGDFDCYKCTQLHTSCSTGYDTRSCTCYDTITATTIYEIKSGSKVAVGNSYCIQCQYNCKYHGEDGKNECAKLIPNNNGGLFYCAMPVDVFDGGEPCYTPPGAGITSCTANQSESAMLPDTYYAMKGEPGETITNPKDNKITMKALTSNTYVGMYTQTGGTAINEGTIEITGNNGTAIGIYGEGQNTIENKGKIYVSAPNAYGIRVVDGNQTHITNTGEIIVNADENAYGIYIDENGDLATVTNEGTISINGNVNNSSNAIVLNGGELRNQNTINVDGDLNISAFNARAVYMEKGSNIIANSIEGELTAGASTVQSSENKDQYIEENSIIANDTSKLEVSSESALFEAKTQTNSEGKTDIVLDRKDFNEFTQNNSMGNYLNESYKNNAFVDEFNKIKSLTSQQQVSKETAKFMGANTLLNFVDENIQVLRGLNRNIAESIFTPDKDEPNRVIAGGHNYSLETDDKNVLSGYDINSRSVYTFGDKRINNWSRLGLGINFTDINTSYEQGGSRDLSYVNIFMPYLYKFSQKLRLASILSLGYGYGEYERDSKHSSDLSQISYGLTNELRYTLDLNGFAELEPAIMLNILGYHENGLSEEGEDSIITKNNHSLSVEAGLGLFIKKQIQTTENSKLGFKVGGIYYHEFASPYRNITAQHRGQKNYWYKINDYANLYKHDRAVIEAVIDYMYKDISIYLKYNKLIQNNNPELFDLGIKYNF